MRLKKAEKIPCLSGWAITHAGGSIEATATYYVEVVEEGVEFRGIVLLAYVDRKSDVEDVPDRSGWEVTDIMSVEFSGKGGIFCLDEPEKIPLPGVTLEKLGKFLLGRLH